MRNEEKEEELSFSAFDQLALVILTARWNLGIPLVAGLAVSFCWDFGHHIDPAMFSVVAQIAPVFLIAMLISDLFMVGRFMEEIGEQKSPDTPRVLGGMIVNRHLALLAAVEVPALIAISLGHSTTFLAMWTSLAMIVFALEFRRNQAHHFARSSRESLQRQQKAAGKS
ncbi:MAG TPA: hypothetical protein VHH14_08705 [Solirubrobacterales bacterium]|nr:hypothetical protein [Solirubrobacterales bacterium]